MKKISIRSGLVVVIMVCWLLPIAIIIALAGVLLTNSYEKSSQQEIQTEAENALAQVETYLDDAIWDSKAVSYDGIIRNAYRDYTQTFDSVKLYRESNDYLIQNFSREAQYRAAFIRYWGIPNTSSAYVLCRSTMGHDFLVSVQRNAQSIVEEMYHIDTGIRFFNLDGNVYMARNLLDTHFRPYATVALLLDPDFIFQSMQIVGLVDGIQLDIDNCTVFRKESHDSHSEDELICYTLDMDGNKLVFSAYPEHYNIWADTPWLQPTVTGIVLLVFPMLLIVVTLFYRHITQPMNLLSDASSQVQGGERGFRIEEEAPNEEFAALYDSFNQMSVELQHQFERAYLEQRATQKAQIKALQSQINPHFLNNTLEIINWEARMAGNEQIGNMIEALSTMLTAALDRDGRTQIPLSEELGYVDAYLYIINERLGGKLKVTREIDPDMNEQYIPRLILQPIVENAVEHDITPNRGGELILHAYHKGSMTVLEVFHNGSITEQDQENIRAMAVSEAPITGHVGLRNVFRRLKLLYGDEGNLTIEEIRPGTVLAKLEFPSTANHI